MRRRWFGGLLALPLLSPCSTHAGAWTQEAGHGQTIYNAVYYTTDEAFDRKGRRIGNPGFRKLEFNPYAEYGLSNDWTLGSSLFFHYLEQDNSAGGVVANRGAAEEEFFTRYQLYRRDGLAFAVQPLLNLPGHYFNRRGPIAGRESWDAELAWLGGYEFSAWGRHHYVDAKAAYRHRRGALRDQYRLSAALGIGISDTLQLVPELQGTIRAQGSGTAVSIAGQNDYELVKGQVSLVWQVADGYALQFGGFRHLAGEDTGAGGGAMAALWVRW